MNNLASRVAAVNRVATQLLDTDQRNRESIQATREQLNARWERFRALADQKKDALTSALNIQNYYLECNETTSWMREKTKVIESTQGLGNDLAGVMALQRKLSGMDAQAMVSKHLVLEQALRDYAHTVHQLSTQSRELVASGHPERSEIRSLFEQYGKVLECDIIKNYGFVHIEDKTAAEDAIRNLHHHKLHGVCINVEASKNKSKASTKLHVGNISPTCTNLELRAKFEEYGPVIECDIVKDYAFVHMERAEDAVEAIRGLDNTEFQGET
nr:PREDICTED: spectrin beta chain, non-erythrocytic 1-like [Apteryx mantelli mantelli]